MIKNKLTLMILIIIFLLIIYFIVTYINKEGFDNNDDNNNIKIYVISLRHEDRIKNIEEQRVKINNNHLEIFDAVKGDKLNIEKLMGDNIISRIWENGPSYKKREIGCYLSHYYIYNKIAANLSSGYTIIFEDDFKIESDNFMDDVNSAIKLTDGNFDLLFLGNINNNHGKLYDKNIYYVDKNETLIGTHCYIVNNKHIEKIISETKDIDMPIDLKIDDLYKKNKLNVLVMFPTIVIQSAESSNIRDITIETFTLYR